MPIRTDLTVRQYPSRGVTRTGVATVTGVAALTVLTLVSACGTAAPSAPPTASTAAISAASGPSGTQAPVPAERNPPGDIPDTTVYVGYRPVNSHVQLRVPEGWSRRDAAASSTFTSNLNSISVAWMPGASAPTVSSVHASTVPALQHSNLAFTLVSVRAVMLKAGAAVETIYQVNSPPNQVTGRQYRLVIERFDLSKGGHGVVLTLSSAVGSDNVDPWRIVSQSLTWS